MNGRFGDPERGVGWTRWSDLARDLSAQALASGQSEAVVVSEIEGSWEPKASPLDWADLLGKL
jgi:hypothetical protein